ncbi:hypothetical protein YC2023_111691 [Brassica napus]
MHDFEEEEDVFILTDVGRVSSRSGGGNGHKGNNTIPDQKRRSPERKFPICHLRKLFMKQGEGCTRNTRSRFKRRESFKRQNRHQRNGGSGVGRKRAEDGDTMEEKRALAPWKGISGKSYFGNGFEVVITISDEERDINHHL